MNISNYKEERDQSKFKKFLDSPIESPTFEKLRKVNNPNFELKCFILISEKYWSFESDKNTISSFAKTA